MQIKMVSSATLALVVSATLVRASPMDKVFELMDDVAAKVRSDGEAEAKNYKEYFSWCDDTSKNGQFEIKTARAQKEDLEAKIGELTSEIKSSTTKIEELTGAIASDEKELKEATAIREKEAKEFAAAEAELVDTVDTLERAVAVLEKELGKGSAAFAQIDMSNTKMLVQALNAIVEAAAFSSSDKDKLVALVQAQQSDDDDDSGAPAAAVYESKAGGIVDVLNDMKDKADGELDELRKGENSAKHNFKMLKQSLDDQISADTTDMEQEKSALEAASEGKATAEGDLTVTNKDLAQGESELATVSADCMQVAADHEANVAAREEELKVIGTAKKILEETQNGAASFLQLKTRSDLKRSEVAAMVKQLARRHHSAALAQLASRIAAVARYGGASADDVFAKIKGMISDMIAKLEKEAEDDATEKAYCDEEMSKTEAKKAELEDDLDKLTSKLDQAAATSTKRKEQVKELQAELAKLAEEQAEMDKIRADENAAYTKSKKDLSLAISGVQKALGVLRDYYGGASLLQEDDEQPAKPAKHEKSGGAGGSIISILEVCESDFTKALAKEETAEADAQSEYDSITQENKMSKTTKDQDVKYKTQEFKALDKEITELSSDRDTVNSELSAVNEYYAQIKDRCVAKPESYEDRKARRDAEIEGLKEAQSVLEEQTAFVQRRKRSGLRGAIA